MKKAVCLFIILIATFSCKNEVVEKPKGLIAKEKMIDIMYDLSLLDGMKYQTDVSKDSLEINPSKFILKKYQVDSLQFAKSNVYYASNYVAYKEMFDIVIKRLDTKKAAIDTILKRENKNKLAKDSVKVSESKPLELDTLSDGNLKSRPAKLRKAAVITKSQNLPQPPPQK